MCLRHFVPGVNSFPAAIDFWRERRSYCPRPIDFFFPFFFFSCYLLTRQHSPSAFWLLHFLLLSIRELCVKRWGSNKKRITFGWTDGNWEFCFVVVSTISSHLLDQEEEDAEPCLCLIAAGKTGVQPSSYCNAWAGRSSGSSSSGPFIRPRLSTTTTTTKCLLLSASLRWEEGAERGDGPGEESEEEKRCRSIFFLWWRSSSSGPGGNYYCGGHVTRKKKKKKKTGDDGPSIGRCRPSPC